MIDRDEWDATVAAVWAEAGQQPESVTLARIDELADQLPPDDAVALFERASARDWAELEADAEALYRQALDAGLDPARRPLAVIQLASTLRNLGRTGEAVELLRADAGGDALDDDRAAFLALALLDHGEPRAALACALRALAPHLTRYRRAVLAYAEEL